MFVNKVTSEELEQRLREVAEKLFNESKPLEADLQEWISKNLWKLYESSDGPEKPTMPISGS